MIETRTSDWDYRRALSELWRRSSYERGLISDPFGDEERARRGLRRMRALLRQLGDPQLAVPTVHVAGSKGKGSTANFIATAAREAGLRTGLYTSPHVHRFPERVAIDGTPIPDLDFARIARTVAEAADAVELREPNLGAITTFDFVTAMGFVSFTARTAPCDLAVIEVGLGGLYDSTNVLAPLVSVITRIDLEHTSVLGPTYADIAFQKAGIIRPGVPCVSSPQKQEAADVIAEAAAKAGANLLIGGRDWRWQGLWRDFTAEGPWGRWTGLSLGVPGPHQIENACTALAALHVVNQAGVVISEPAIRRGLAAAHWPGRFERRRIAGQDVVFDGAHTPAAAAALVETWREEFGSARATVILGMGSDKNAGAFLTALRPIIGRLIVTRSDSPRAADPAEIVATATSVGLPADIAPTVAAAVADAVAEPLLITGSLFVAGEGREALGLAEPDLEWRALNEEHRPQISTGTHHASVPR